MALPVQKQKTIYTYLSFLLFAGIGILYGNIIQPDYLNIRLWTTGSLLFLLIGIPFVLFQAEAGLPEFWDVKNTNKDRIWKPLVVGLFFGFLDVIVIKAIMHPEPYTELPPFLQPFPYSIFLYASGAFEIEVFYRLVPLTLLLFIGKKFRSGKYWIHFFWISAVLTSLREPIEQYPDGPSVFITYSLVSGFLMNFFQAIFYRNAGFLASLSLRLGHYLLWHILLGIFVEYKELN